jgi:hypothetical protein
VKSAQWLILAGSIVLLATALVHGSAYNAIAHGMEASSARPFLVSAMKVLWLAYSFHLVVLSVVFLLASRTRGGKRLVLVCALIPAGDILLGLSLVGVFIGNIMLALATLLFVAGGLLLQSDH